MKRTPTPLLAARTQRLGSGQRLSLGWQTAALVSCLFCSTVVPCGATDRPPDGNKGPIAQTSSTLSVDKTLIPKGWNAGADCVDDADTTLPNIKKDQTITIVVAPGRKGGTKFQVLAFPNCAGISHDGKLNFVLDKRLLEAGIWESTNTVKIEFDVEGATTPVNGPFDKVDGKPEERGIYKDVFGKDENGKTKDAISGKAMGNKILKGWKGRYLVTVRDSATNVLGASDPGVKVIDGP